MSCKKGLPFTYNFDIVLNKVEQTVEQTVRDFLKIKKREVQIGSLTIGAGDFSVIAGPCSIESEDQFRMLVSDLYRVGVSFIRGGIFKMRTNPQSFQGLGFEALEIIKTLKKEKPFLIASEVTDPRQISDMLEVVDVFQVGSRNMYNYSLLKELGKIDKPILLKRGFSALVSEWLLAAEYVVSNGNDQVILCERGIRSFETTTRNTLDLNSVAFIKKNSNFPVLVDPSHGVGVSALVPELCWAAVCVGADGLLVEVHDSPEKAFSDGFQALTVFEYQKMMNQLKKVLTVFDRKLAQQ